MSRLLCLSAIVASALASTAQNSESKSYVDIQHDSLIASHKIISFGPGSDSITPSRSDSIRSLVEAFYYDQFRHFQDPDSPYFLFMSRDATLAMGIGGAVRMRGYFDWDGAIPASGFAPYLIPMHPDPTKMRKFDTTPAGTCLFFRVIGRNKKFGNYQLYIEANFNGYQARDFHLKKAYATINDWTIGYANSTFSDPAAQPATVDAQGPSNKITPTNVLVRWMPRFKNHWVAAVSVETPSTSYGTTEHTAAVDNWIPDAAVFLQYEWGHTSHVRLSGIVRSLSYRDLVSSTNHYRAGWGLMLSTVFHPLPQLTVFGTANYGHGYASLGGDLLIGKYDLIANPDKDGEMYAPASLGWCAGVQYNIRPNIFVSTSLSETRFLPSRTVAGTEYRYGLFGDVNIFWNLTPRIQVGAEFDYGKRADYSGEYRWAKRIGAICQFSF